MIINMTPHDIVIVGKDDETLKTIPPCGTLVRLSSETVDLGHIGTIPITKTVYGDPVGLPEQADNVFYIVSQLVRSALRNRSDLLVPAELVRDGDGRIIGCRSLGM